MLKCDVIILQIFTFEHQNHVTQCTQQLQKCVHNFKSLALLKVKIEPFKVPYSTILSSYFALVPNEMRGFSMEQFELRRPTSQLSGGLKIHFWGCESLAVICLHSTHHLHLGVSLHH